MCLQRKSCWVRNGMSQADSCWNGRGGPTIMMWSFHGCRPFWILARAALEAWEALRLQASPGCQPEW